MRIHRKLSRLVSHNRVGCKKKRVDLLLIVEFVILCGRQNPFLFELRDGPIETYDTTLKALSILKNDCN